MQAVDALGNILTKEQQAFFKNSKVRSSDNKLLPVYHGTRRADRVGNYFDPQRATSGPMAFFTSSKDIATNYSKDKKDTSLELEDNAYNYTTWFKYSIGNKYVPLPDAWYYLSAKARMKIQTSAPHVTFDDQAENIIYDEEVTNGAGAYDSHIREARGNVLTALIEEWLNSGSLIDDEEKFLDVLALSGIDISRVKYDNPYKVDSKVYSVYLNITNPFITSDVPNEIIDAFIDAAEIQPEPEYLDGVDLWDKRTKPAKVWLNHFLTDLHNDTLVAWTSIPDWVTNILKEFKYDGIIDKGGKYSGVEHAVYVPFYSEQIKSIHNLMPTVSKNINEDKKPTRTVELGGRTVSVKNSVEDFDATQGEWKETDVINATYKSAKILYYKKKSQGFWQGTNYTEDDFAQDAVLYILGLFRKQYFKTDYDTLEPIIYRMLAGHYVNNVREKELRLAHRNELSLNRTPNTSDYTDIEIVDTYASEETSSQDSIEQQELIAYGEELVNFIIDNLSFIQYPSRKHVYKGFEKDLGEINFSEASLAKLIFKGYNSAEIARDIYNKTALGTSSEATRITHKVSDVINKLAGIINDLEPEDREAIRAYMNTIFKY